MKNLVIKNEISNPERTYEFNLEFMHGDADGYSTETMFVSQDNPMLQEYANFLASLKGEENGNKLHKEFFKNEKFKTDEFEELCFDYPYDNTADYAYPASCTGLNIFYYDEMGKKFDVKLE